MTYRWTLPDVPRKDWTCEYAEDTGSPDHTCEMCRNPQVRYVHHMTHPAGIALAVGCECAAHMSEGYAARAVDREMKSRAARRERWVKPESWRLSARGNLYRKKGGRLIVIWGEPPSYGVHVDDQFLGTFPSETDAMLAAFDYLYHPNLVRAT